MAQEYVTKYAWRLTSPEYRKTYKQGEPWHYGYETVEAAMEDAIAEAGPSALLFSRKKEEHKFEIAAYQVLKVSKFINEITLDESGLHLKIKFNNEATDDDNNSHYKIK